MANRTLRYGQTPDEAMGIGLRPRPNDPWSAAAATGLGGLTPSAADSLIQKMPESSIGDFDYSVPEMKASPSGGDDILFDSGSGTMSVNGFEFQVDDYADAVRSKEYLGQGGVPRKPGAWSPLSREQYSEYLGRIEDPTLGTRFKRSFELGTQGLKTLGGAGLQFLGAEELGSGIVNRASERSEELSPFQASAADVASGELSAIEYAVSMIGQQGPNIIETIGVGLAGFAAGTATTANPVGGALASVGAMFSKAAFKKVAKEAAEQYTKGGIKSLSAAQRKALSQLGGAGAATAINNYAIGTADIYNEQRERGAGAGDKDARAIAAALGIPYAILSTIPEAIAASKLFGLSGVSPSGVAKRLFKGAVVGGTLEGATEAGQEVLNMTAGGRYRAYEDDEYLSRIIESAVAGFTVGGTIGGIVNLRKGKPVDALGSATETEVETAPETKPLLALPPPEQNVNPLLALPSPTSIPGQVITPPPPIATPAPIVTPAPVEPAPIVTPAPVAPVAPVAPAPDSTGQAEMFTPTEMGLDTATQARITGQELPFTGNVLRPTVQVTDTQAELEDQGQLRFTESFNAPPPPPPSSSAMFEGLNPLRQAMNQAQEDQRKAEADRTQRDADFQAAERQRSKQAFEDTLTVDEYVDATSLWDQFNDSRKKLSSKVTLDSRQMDAQREWVQAVREGTANKQLFDKLRKTKAQPKGQREPLIRKPNEPDGPPTGGKKTLKKKAEPKKKTQPKKTLKKKAEPKKKTLKKTQPKEAVVVEPKVEPKPVVEEDLSVGRDAYNDFKKQRNNSTLPEFASLSASEQRSINTKATKGTLTDADLSSVALNAPVGTSLEPEEQIYRDSSVDDMISNIETEVGAKYKQNLYALVRTAYFSPTKGKGIKKRNQAREYLDDFIYNDDSRAVLLVVAEELETINVMDSKGVNPGFTLLQQQGLIPDLLNVGVEFNTAKAGGRVATPANIKEELANTKPNDNTSIMEFVDAMKEKPAGQNRASGRFSLDGAVTEDGTPVRAMANGRVRMLARQFINKLEVKPKLFVYRDQADLKARNPQLHKAAAAARTEGDFDTQNAVGYAFDGSTVIIFSDKIANQQHLNFVMAHEVLGHYGLRSIVPKKQFNALMESLYDNNEYVQSAVDSTMEAYGQSKAEAVEEYIADYAAVIDTSVIARISNAIKKFLNKFGAKFGDEDIRYLVDQSRKYTRTNSSGGGQLVIMSEVAQQYKDVTTNTGEASTGRFAPATNMRVANIIAAKAMGQGKPLPTNWEEIWKEATSGGKDIKDRFDRFSAKYLSLSNYRARKNAGLADIHQMFMAHGNIASDVRIRANDTMRAALNRKFGPAGQITNEQTNTVNTMLFDGQRKALNLFNNQYGKVSLLQIIDSKPEVIDKELARLKKMGTRTLQELRDGYTYQDVYLDENNVEQSKTVDVKGIPNLTDQSIEYIAYKKVREAMDNVEIELVKAKYNAYLQEKANVMTNLNNLIRDNGRLTTEDKTAIRGIIDYMGELYVTDLTTDNKGMLVPSATAMANAEKYIESINKYLIGATKDKGKTVQTFYEGTNKAKGQDVVAQLDSLRSRLLNDDSTKFLLQEEVRRVMLSDYLNRESDLYAKRSIATGYTPVMREGRFQIRIQAKVNGKVVQLHERHQDLLVYKQVDKASDAERLAGTFNEDMGKVTSFKALVKDTNTGDFTTQSVTLEAVSEAVLDSVSGPPELNLNDFVRGIQFFDINLSPTKMERVVTGLTRQNASARQRLERSFTPGGDLDGVLSVSQHIDKRAATIAKTQLRPAMTNLMNLNLRESREKWRMDGSETKQRLANLKAMKEDMSLSQAVRTDASYQYAELDSMVKNTQRGGTNYGNEYHAEAARGIDFLNNNRDVSMSDFEASKMAAGVRSFASLFQLGGSIATGTLNFIGVYVNGLPYLSSHNSKTGFGGGFGFASIGSINKAMADVGVRGLAGDQLQRFGAKNTGLNFDRAEFYDGVAKSKTLQAEHNLTELEAKFLAQEIREGVMIPAQSNAMMGLSRGNMSKAWMQKFVDAFMYPFNATERGARRGFGLAAYRLEFARLKSVGKSDAEANAGATKFSVEAINNTMGEYSVLNRPDAFRNGWMSFVYMYKVYPVTSIQMFANLSRNGKLGMLTSLIVMSGMSGIPLAEDLEDLIDTLGQALGFKSGSVRFEAAKLLEDLYPGSSKFLLTGALNQVMPIDIGGRVSLGNVIPGTGFFLSGSDKYREIKDIFGPAYGFLEQSGEFAYLAASAPLSSTVTTSDALRKAPSTTVRNFADAFAYLKNGTVVDKRGYTVTEDMGSMLLLGRLLGFYPKEAADQYGAIKYAKRVTDYQRNVTTEFKQAWLKGNKSQRRSIEKSVKEWNKTAKGTPMEIRNFRKNVRKAEKEARKTAAQRTLRSSPLAARKDLDKFFEAMVAD